MYTPECLDSPDVQRPPNQEWVQDMNEHRANFLSRHDRALTQLFLARNSLGLPHQTSTWDMMQPSGVAYRSPEFSFIVTVSIRNNIPSLTHNRRT